MYISPAAMDQSIGYVYIFKQLQWRLLTVHNFTLSAQIEIQPHALVE